ncbi:MAG: NADH-quinone oxidoreductase subunit A [Elusimicrobia bacterium]|nr:NADH-quinone oxidoreductase subunit A [Elusimicrobiota bacterium]
MNEFALIVNLLAVLALVLSFSNAGRFLGPKTRREGDKDMPYETGVPPFEPAMGRMSVLYYRFAVLFVVFDVDLAFLLPWALTRASLTPESMIAMSFFVGLLGFMLIYFWNKGALECR